MCRLDHSTVMLHAHRLPVQWRCVLGCLLLIGGHTAVIGGEAVAGEAENQPVLAIENSMVSAEIEVLDPLQAEQERLRQLLDNQPKAYQDKVMNTDALAELRVVDEAKADEPEGLRAYVLESRLGFAQTDSTLLDASSTQEAGVRLEYRFDTQNYGEFVGQLDANSPVSSTGSYVSNSDSAWGTQSQTAAEDKVRVTLRNLGLPVTSNILADTALGDISSEVTEAFGRSYRLSLGTDTVRGIGTRIYNGDFDLRVGSGQRGELSGEPYPAFTVLDGELSWLGFSHKLGDKAFAGIQLNQVRGSVAADSTAAQDGDKSDGYQNVTSLVVAAGYGRELQNAGDRKLRVTWIQSQMAGSVALQDKEASGLFVEAGFQHGRTRHELGAYTTEPGLQFGDNALMANSRGAYWRIDQNGTRLDIGGGVDMDQYNPGGLTSDGLTTERVSLGGNAQYRIDRHRSLGGSLYLSESRSARMTDQTTDTSDTRSRSVRGSVFYQLFNRDWGRSRLSATVHRNETVVSNGVAATGDEIQWEQDWITGKYETMRPELTTTLGLAHDRSVTDTQTYPTAGISTRYWFDSNWTASAQLRYTSRSGNLFTSQGLSGTVATELKLNNGWQLGVSANLNQAKVEVSGNDDLDAQISRTTDKSAYVYVRWEGTAGKPYAMMGVRNKGHTGSGSIAGTVFFDLNRDGERQSDETDVSGVEVYLDGRYRAMTDKAGRFEFAQVTTGRHSLSLNPDSVPLPWGAASQREVNVDVQLRSEATAYMPVVKVIE